MKDFLKENWFKIALVLLVIFGFYWFAYRPTQISERCYAEAEFDAVSVLDYSAFGGESRQDHIDRYHQNCLKRFGLE
jgi:hypothetical protein